MKIGIAGPATLELLKSYVKNGEQLPAGYLFAPMAVWIEGLISRGHQISLFTLAPEIDQPKTFLGENLNIHIGRYRSRHRARDFFKQERRDLLVAMRNDPVDILHAHWTYEFALAALNSGFPTLVTAHDAPLNIFRLSRDLYRLARFFMAWQVCRCAPMLTAVSPYIEKHFRRVFGFKGPIHMIPNGLPEIVFDLSGLPSINKPKGKLIFASNLTGWAGLKNGQTLIKAFAQVRSDYPHCELWMYGTGHGEGDAAQAWAKKNGIADDIQFRGHVPYLQLLKELAINADVLVHPALEESFSMAIAEAMALRIPVVGGKDSGAVVHTMAEGGIPVDVRNSSEMAKTMIALAKNPALREKLGNAGHNHARTHYSLMDVMAQYEFLYDQLAISGDRNK